MPVLERLAEIAHVEILPAHRAVHEMLGLVQRRQPSGFPDHVTVRNTPASSWLS
jgi:hypothetical protein